MPNAPQHGDLWMAFSLDLSVLLFARTSGLTVRVFPSVRREVAKREALRQRRSRACSRPSCSGLLRSSGSAIFGDQVSSNQTFARRTVLPVLPLRSSGPKKRHHVSPSHSKREFNVANYDALSERRDCYLQPAK
jgi:hypothetical protein